MCDVAFSMTASAVVTAASDLRSEKSEPASPTDTSTLDSYGSSCFVCSYPGCAFMRQRRRHNAERHVWNQHVRKELHRDKEPYCAREHRELVKKYITPIDDDSEDESPTPSPTLLQCAYIQPKPISTSSSSSSAKIQAPMPPFGHMGVHIAAAPYSANTYNVTVTLGRRSSVDASSVGAGRVVKSKQKYTPFPSEVRRRSSSLSSSSATYQLHDVHYQLHDVHSADVALWKSASSEIPVQATPQAAGGIWRPW
eukprot:comp4829_c0_seq1/m.948 comp4829_c0_seq1/g.948  ORF comp4829_c0_seq1/g.948 comp4829_c0_seq1/m.948 type:complete len:253 (-) comp4829_c0_seq1:617-1375(-)